MDEVKNNEIDIIIGTQLVAKGLDLKELEVVGITNADSTLTLPDYTSNERMFQLTLQTIGRVGRGHGNGICIIQTYQPDNPLFTHLQHNDWQAFSQEELNERRLFRYPPFTFLLKLSCKRKTEKGSEKAAQDLSKKITEMHKKIELIGPSPSFFAKQAGQYQWQIVIKSRDRSKLLQIARNVPANWQAELDPLGLL